MLGKKSMMCLFLSLALLGMLIVPSLGMAGWVTCNVVQVGPSGSNSYIQLTDTSASPQFSGRWFHLSSANATTLLAAALTAISAGKTVKVNLVSNTEMSDVISLYVNY